MPRLLTIVKTCTEFRCSAEIIEIHYFPLIPKNKDIVPGFSRQLNPPLPGGTRPLILVKQSHSTTFLFCSTHNLFKSVQELTLLRSRQPSPNGRDSKLIFLAGNSCVGSWLLRGEESDGIDLHNNFVFQLNYQIHKVKNKTYTNLILFQFLLHHDYFIYMMNTIYISIRILYPIFSLRYVGFLLFR